MEILQKNNEFSISKTKLPIKVDIHEEILVKKEFSKGEGLNLVPKTFKMQMFGHRSKPSNNKIVTKNKVGSLVESEISQIINFDKLSTRPDDRRTSLLNSGNNNSLIKLGSFDNRSDVIRLKHNCFNSNSQSNSLLKSHE
jgi:hypothetical protein